MPGGKETWRPQGRRRSAMSSSGKEMWRRKRRGSALRAGSRRARRQKGHRHPLPTMASLSRSWKRQVTRTPLHLLHHHRHRLLLRHHPPSSLIRIRGRAARPSPCSRPGQGPSASRSTPCSWPGRTLRGEAGPRSQRRAGMARSRGQRPGHAGTWARRRARLPRRAAPPRRRATALTHETRRATAPTRASRRCRLAARSGSSAAPSPRAR